MEAPWPPMHRAARDGDVDALRRAVETNVSPDVACPDGLVPLHCVVHYASRHRRPHGVSDRDREDTYNRVACIHLLIDAGANVSAATQENRMTALMYAAAGGHPTLVAALLDAGSDVNSLSSRDWMPLHYALYSDQNSEECARLLINAGAAVDASCDVLNGYRRTPLELATLRRFSRIYPILLRAGAALPAHPTAAYLRKVRAAGGIKKYERAHLNASTASFAPKFSHLLPPELVRRVVEYAFHVGDYWTTSVRAE